MIAPGMMIYCWEVGYSATLFQTKVHDFSLPDYGSPSVFLGVAKQSEHASAREEGNFRVLSRVSRAVLTYTLLYRKLNKKKKKKTPHSGKKRGVSLDDICLH